MTDSTALPKFYVFFVQLFFVFVCSCKGIKSDAGSWDISNVVERLTRLETIIVEQQVRLDSLELENARLSAGLRKLNQHFAFSAYATDFAQYENGDKINFTGVITNIGSHYDAVQSQFICPVAATYYFAINMKSQTNGYLVQAEMMKGDVMIGNAEVQDTELYAHMASNCAVVSCAAGERVWVRSGARIELHGENAPFTTFTGFLLEYD